MSNTENLGLRIPTLAEKNIHTTYVNNNAIIDNAYGQYIDDYEQSLENVAPIEGSTASTNYTVGQYLVKDGGLYKVTSNIASGEDIVVGTNVAATSLNDAVVELNTAVATLQDSLYTATNVTVIQTLTSNTVTRITVPSYGWYFVRAINTDVGGACFAYIVNANSDGYIAASESGTGTWMRATTAPVPMRSGTVVDVRAAFTSYGEFCKLS